MLGCGVSGAALVCGAPGNRPDVDDDALARGGEEGGQDGLGHPHDASNVDIEHDSPGVEVGGGDGLQPVGAAGVVDEHVDDRTGDPGQLGDVRVGGDVARDEVAGAPGRGDLLRDRGEAVGAASGAYNSETLGGQGQGGRGTDPAARAGDNCGAHTHEITLP